MPFMHQDASPDSDAAAAEAIEKLFAQYGASESAMAAGAGDAAEGSAHLPYALDPHALEELLHHLPGVGGNFEREVMHP